MFSKAFFNVLIVASLLLTAAAVVALLWLLVRDFLRERLW